MEMKGTKAAAVTDIAMALGYAPAETLPTKYIYLNRPFLYAIADEESGLPYFIGVQNSYR